LTQLTTIVSPDVNDSSSTPNVTPSNSLNEVVKKAKAVVAELAVVIQETDDASRLEELLGINDQLLALLKKVPASTKPSLRLHGLGLSIDRSQSSEDDGDNKLHGLPHLNGRANGHSGHHIETSSETSSVGAFEDDEDQLTPTTPKIDKGKRKAEPEPEQSDMVLSPKTFMINDAENESEMMRFREGEGDVASPTDRYVLVS